MTEAEEKMTQAKTLLQKWVDQQGHDRCWYYPDVFRELATLLGVEVKIDPKLPPLQEFQEGCKRYQKEEYEQTTQFPETKSL
jgi:hypothetical protein